jgi:ankyrin repeat protein
MAKASFSLCLAFSSAQMLTSLTRDEALNLLAKAAVLGHRAASLIGPRVFEANEHQVPASLEERLEDLNIDNRVPTDLDAEETFFANAVKDLFGRELRAKLRRRLSRRGIIERTGQLIPWINEQNKNLQTDDYLINFAEESLLLHASIAFEDVEAANFLLDMGCTVDLEGPEGLTPLLIACQCANKTLINVLLTHGADASKTGHDGVTTLHWLILFPHRDIKDTLEALVSHGADIDRSMKQGTYMCFDGLSLALENTALSWAVLCRDHSVVSALLQAGAKEDLESSMKFALRLVCPDVAEILMTHGRDRCQFFTENPWYDIGDETSREFQRWVIHGKKYASAYARTMDWLISHGSDYPGCWKDTNSPMYHAVMCCNIPLAEELLKRGADISEVGRTSRATLLAALISCDVVELSDSSKKMRMAKLLLNNGVPLEPGPYDENFPTKTFLSGPIHLACVFKAPLSMIELLSGYCIEHINRRYNGKTPLQALPGAHSDEETAQIVRYLLSLKADPEAETTHWNMWGEGFWNCCHRPIALVARNRYLASTVTLLDYGVSPIMGVSGNHQFTVLHELVREAMRDMQRRDDFSSGEKRMADFIDLVLDHPLPQKDDWVNIADSQGYTVIWYAIHWGLPATVEVLLNHNAKREGLQHGADLKAVLSYSYEHPPSFVQDAGEYETILFMCSYISPTNSSGYKHRLGKISKLLSMAG